MICKTKGPALNPCAFRRLTEALYARAFTRPKRTAASELRRVLGALLGIGALALSSACSVALPSVTDSAYTLTFTAELSGNCGSVKAFDAALDSGTGSLMHSVGLCSVDHEPCSDEHAALACNGRASTWLCYHDTDGGIEGTATISFHAPAACSGEYLFEGLR